MIRKLNCNFYKKRVKGLTLIELLIAVVIIGVLSAVAYPSYKNYVIEGHRASAKADMARIQLALENKYDTEKRVYVTTGIMTGTTCDICETDSDRYQFSIDLKDSTHKYIITATAQTTKGQTNDECLTKVDPANTTMKLYQNNTTYPAKCW